MSSRSSRSRGVSRAEAATQRAVKVREAGLQQISVITRGMTAAVVALSGAFAVIAANGFHGHKHQHAAAQPQTTATSSISSALQPASQPPVRTPASPVAVAGGS